MRAPVISVMLAVVDAPQAVAWYKRALGAVELWSLGSVAGLEIAGAPFFVGEPERNGWEAPGARHHLGQGRGVLQRSRRTDRPRLAAGATGRSEIRDHAHALGAPSRGGFVGSVRAHLARR
jgi:hypothetical protein